MNLDSYLANQWNHARSGDLEAYGDIYQQLFPKLYHYLRKIINDEDLSQDLIQDLFVKLWDRKERIGPIYNVRQYFFRSARSLVCNHYKSTKRKGVFLEIGDVDFVFSREDILVQEEDQQFVESQILYALNSLSQRRREMIYLKYYQNLNYSEISAMTGITYQSVANHVHRAILQMRDVITDKKGDRSTENSISSYMNADIAKYLQYAE